MTKDSLSAILGSEWQVEDGSALNGVMFSDRESLHFLPKLCLFYNTLDSTNDAADRLNPALFEGREVVVLVTRQQTAGHGRLGRVWHAKAGEALTFTLLAKLHRSRPMGHWPLLAAWSQLRAYGTWMSLLKCDLKWPNDVLIEGKKVSGVLCGMRKLCGADWLSLGLGVNVSTMDFPEEIRHLATSLADHIPSSSQPTVLQVLSVLLECILEDLHDLSADELLSQFQSKSSICRGAQIRYLEQNMACHGVTHGLDPSGALLCQTNGGIKPLLVSEVFQVRKEEG